MALFITIATSGDQVTEFTTVARNRPSVPRYIETYLGLRFCVITRREL